VVWFHGVSAHALFTSIVGHQSVSVSATITAVSEQSTSAVVLVTAITGLQLQRHFWLWPKPEKLVSVGLYSKYTLCRNSYAVHIDSIVGKKDTEISLCYCFSYYQFFPSFVC